jgi:Raf kinase inhibitor-like YbhB/YbcL family protein
MSDLKLESPAFAQGAAIPARYTCHGEDRSPPLEWSGVPPGTRSFVLIVDDPDAPALRRPWVHWLRYNLPSDQRAVAEGEGNRAPTVGEDARTDADALGYHGPCPPSGRHRYYFRLFALDAVLRSLGPTTDRGSLERAMAGHVLGKAELMGTCARTAGRDGPPDGDPDTG